MSGAFGNLFQFGRSNANNPGTPTNVGAPQVTPQQQQTQPKHDPTQITNGNTGAADNTGGAPIKDGDKKEDSPLDIYKDIFTIPTDDKGNPIQPSADPLSSPVIDFDPAKLQEALKGKNLVGNVPQELLQKAMSGNDPQAFMQVLNLASTNSFQLAIGAASKMVESAISKHTANLEAALPSRIRDTQIRQSSVKNPVLSHPAAAPMVEALKMQIAVKNPQLSPDRVTEMAENYFIAMSKELGNNDGTPKSGTGTNGKETNWLDLLSA